MQIVDTGLILRETPYKEADVMLTILTECRGKISVLARGARRKGSRFSAAIQLLTYSEFTLYESSGRYSLNEADPIEMFGEIRKDIVKLSLASYFAEVLEQAADEETINPELLRLGLNSIYAVANTEISPIKIKAAFELRVAAMSGYLPNVYRCSSCGSDSDIVSFDIKNGIVFCKECSLKSMRKINSAVVDAMRYIFNTDIKRIFSFKINDASMKILSEIADEYLSFHFDRAFKTNKFYKSLL